MYSEIKKGRGKYIAYQDKIFKISKTRGPIMYLACKNLLCKSTAKITAGVLEILVI